MRIEHYALQEMAKGRTSRQIASALSIHINTLRNYLRHRGFRILCDCRLVPIESDQLHPGQGPAAE